MSNELIELELDEISIVNAGANQHADIVLYKQKELSEMSDDVKKEDVAPTDAPTMEQRMASLEDSIKQIMEAIAALQTTEDSEMQMDKEEDNVEKSDLQKALDEKEVELQKYRNAAEVQKFEKAAEKYDALPINPSELGVILRKTQEVTELTKFLDSMQEVLAKSELFKEFGTNDKDMEMDAEAKLNNIAKSISTEEGITFEAAYTKALKANPELYAELNK